MSRDGALSPRNYACVIGAVAVALCAPAALLGLAWPHLPLWGRMWGLCFTLFAACKILTWRRAAWIPHGAGRTLGYLLAWPGMDARAFFSPMPPERRMTACQAQSEAAAAAGKMLFGAALLWGAARAALPHGELLAAWMGATGLILILHFGLLHLVSVAWRAAGVDARPIMNAPLRSTSLSEFWSRRWNSAFHDLAHEFVFEPAARRCGASAAMFTAFLASGLVHDLVISVPAGRGFGLPTTYFLLQAAGVTLERSRFGRAIGIRRGARGWLFMAVLTAGPAYILFHPAFMAGVMLPFLREIGAFR